MILSIILTLIFIGLSILHFNWVFGGQYGFAESLPTKENGERVLNPGKMDSAIVAFGLLIFGFFYLVQSGLIEFSMPDWMLKVGGWIIPIIFLLRAVGEFKYVGFFKSVKTTAFGKLDT
ncbi:MAG: DUF3995 domain-containing protein, partial [Saprospiraceae bacterium]|nr:DUF3995 domain-containing protein [Saprospiraceae bacterium]